MYEQLVISDKHNVNLHFYFVFYVNLYLEPEIYWCGDSAIHSGLHMMPPKYIPTMK